MQRVCFPEVFWREKNIKNITVTTVDHVHIVCKSTQRMLAMTTKYLGLEKKKCKQTENAGRAYRLARAILAMDGK